MEAPFRRRARPATPLSSRHDLVGGRAGLRESVECLAPPGDLFEARIAAGWKGLRQPQSEIEDHAGKRDIGLRHASTEKPWFLGVAIEMNQRSGDLSETSRHPFMSDAGGSVKMPLVDDTAGLLDCAGSENRRLENAAALIAGARNEGASGSCELVEIIEDRRTVEQGLAAIDDERGIRTRGLMSAMAGLKTDRRFR